MNDTTQLFVKVIKENSIFIISDVETKEIIDNNIEKIPEWMLRKAVKYNRYLKKSYYSTGKVLWRQVDPEKYISCKLSGIEIPAFRNTYKK